METVAIAAVMAGARPEHLPVLLAIASTGQPAIQPSTLPFASALLVNGPIRNEIGMNSGMGALGPYNLANAVIGRAWTLMQLGIRTAQEDLLDFAGQQLHLQQSVHGRERRAQRLGAVPRAKGT